MNTTEQTVLKLLANTVFGTKYDISSDVNWQEVYHECVRQAIVVLAWQEARKYVNVIPEDLYAKWNKKSKIQVANSVLVRWSHVNLDNMMTQNNIDYVILKGCASASYYPDPTGRILGDVDFLVRKESVEKAGNILKQAGFRSWDREEHACHIVYKNENEHLELHFEPAGIPYGKAGELVRTYLNDIMKDRRRSTENEEKMFYPSHFHHGLILLLHTIHHMLGEGIGLRHLCDWAVFYSHFTENEFCTLFEEKLKKIGIWHFAQLLTMTAEKCFSSPHRVWAESAEDWGVVNAIIKDIFDGGNFGQKNNKRVYSALLISSRGKNGVEDNSFIKQFCMSMNDIVKSEWPISKTIPIIIPFGWCYFILRRLIKGIMGKKDKLQFKKVIQEADWRKNVYKKFKLFETEK